MFRRVILIGSLVLNLAFVVLLALWVARRGGIGELLAARERGANAMQSHRDARLELFRALPESPPGAYLLLGDSLTEMGAWSELLGPRALNRGISGERAADLLRRLDAGPARAPDAVVVMSGINDLLSGVPSETVARVLGEILGAVRARYPDARIFLQSLLPVRGVETPDAGERILQVNRMLPEIARAHGAAYVDLHTPFTDDTGRLREEMTTDGLHLSTAAYVRWAALLRKELEGTDE